MDDVVLVELLDEDDDVLLDEDEVLPLDVFELPLLDEFLLVFVELPLVLVDPPLVATSRYRAMIVILASIVVFSVQLLLHCRNSLPSLV